MSIAASVSSEPVRNGDGDTVPPTTSGDPTVNKILFPLMLGAGMLATGIAAQADSSHDADSHGVLTIAV